MNTLHPFFPAPVVQALGWTLIHALWQGALCAIILAVLLIWMRRFSSTTRYAVSIVMLLIFLTATISTFFLSWSPPSIQQGQSQGAASLQPLPLHSDPNESALTQEFDATAASLDKSSEFFPAWTTWKGYLTKHIPLFVTCWLLGVLVLLLRFLGSLAFIQRLKVYQSADFPASWEEKLRNLSQQLGLRKKIQGISSHIAITPMAIGVLKPAIIIPAKLFSRLSEDQIRAILIHELAHLKRNDFLVNMLQSVVEIIFFYHPGIWWISANIRNERENCCDDVAVSLLGEPFTYAKTLIELQEERQIGSIPAMAFSGIRYKFGQRIRRLLNQPPVLADFKEGFVTALVLILGIVALGFGTHQGRSQALFNPLNTPMTEQVNDTLKSPVEIEPEAVRPLPKEEKPLIALEAEKPIQLPSTPDRIYSPADSSQSQLKLLFLAIHEKDPKLVSFILDKGVNINGTNSAGRTPLIEAAHEGSLSIAKILLEAGAQLEQEAGDGYTALLEAAEHGARELVELFIEKGAAINQADNKGQTPLIQAAHRGNYEVVKLLLEKGADAGKKTLDGSDALHLASLHQHHEVTDLLSKHMGISQPAYKPSAGGRKFTCKDLLRATLKVEMYVMRELLKTVDPDCAYYGDGEPRTALVAAARMGNIDLIKLLIEAGANAEYHGKGDESPLIAAANNGHLEVAQYLVANGAKVNAKHPGDGTALIGAVRGKHYEVAEYLLEQGADPYLEVRGDEYPMYHARSQGDKKMVALLKKYEK